MRRWTARLVCLLLILSAAAGGAHAQEGSAVLSSSGVGTAFSLASSNGAEQKTASLTQVLSSGQELTEAATVYEVPLGTVISEPEGGTQALLVRLYDSDGVLCTFDGTDEASRLAMLAQAAGVPWSGGDGQEGESAVPDGLPLPITIAKECYYWFEIPAQGSYICVKGVASLPVQPGTGGAADFSDVPEGAYYRDAVNWAVGRGVTSGTSASTFSPNLTCTRGQVITFLWRAMGQPAPAGDNPFRDVSRSDYYYQAALWAYEQGITSGAAPGVFAPNAACTRAQVITFLWQAEGRPEGGGTAGFADVRSGDYFARAVSWAVSRGITSGTSAGRFSPHQACTRAQVVTFLYQDMARLNASYLKE